MRSLAGGSASIEIETRWSQGEAVGAHEKQRQRELRGAIDAALPSHTAEMLTRRDHSFSKREAM